MIKLSNQKTEIGRMYKDTWSKYMLSPRDSLEIQRHKQVESEGWKNTLCENNNQKRARAAILVSDKTDFTSKKVSRDKEGLDILIKGLIQQENIIINIYTPNYRP